MKLSRNSSRHKLPAPAGQDVTTRVNRPRQDQHGVVRRAEKCVERTLTVEQKVGERYDLGRRMLLPPSGKWLPIGIKHHHASRIAPQQGPPGRLFSIAARPDTSTGFRWNRAFFAPVATYRALYRRSIKAC